MNYYQSGRRCNQILKRLSLNPNEEDDFIDEDLTIRDYLRELFHLLKKLVIKNLFLILIKLNQKITKSIEIFMD